MKLISMNCPDCGASLNVKNNTKQVKCDYCGGIVFLQDNSMTVKHLASGDITEEQEFINAETYLNKLQDYAEAYECYKSLSKRYVDNPEIWLGLLRSYTNDFSRKAYDYYFKEKMNKAWNNFKSLAKPEDIEEYAPKYEEYLLMLEATKPLHNTSNPKMDTLNNSYKDNHALRIIVILFLGAFGVHKFLDGKPWLGVLYIFTYGLFGVGILIDLIVEIKKINNNVK